MTILDIQVVEPAILAAKGTDIRQRMPCQERDCKYVAPLASMFIWALWRESQQKWIYFPFCHDHVLTCLPVNALPKG